MERRSFVRGLLAAVAGGEAVVKLATPSDVAALTVGRATLIGQPDHGRASVTDARWLDRVGDEVYIRVGRQYVCVGYLTELIEHTDPFEVTNVHDAVRRYVPSPFSHLEGRFVGPRRSAR